MAGDEAPMQVNIGEDGSASANQADEDAISNGVAQVDAAEAQPTATADAKLPPVRNRVDITQSLKHSEEAEKRRKLK